MKVIFLASGNVQVGRVNSFVQSQFDSLKAIGLDMKLMPIVGHGVLAHLKAVRKLRRIIRTERPDIVHAHYSICGYVASIACLGLKKRPRIVVSILGSFPRPTKKLKLVRFCIKHLWDRIIVKSRRTANQLGLPVSIIPNGVNLDVFKMIPQSDAKRQLGFENDKKYIIWCSNPIKRPEKNWPLAVESVKVFHDRHQEYDVELLPIYNHTSEEVAIYMNAADCLLHTSDTEGSPNVIKEALACNCPIVTTDVGDVSERLEGLDGCYIIHDDDCRFSDPHRAAELIATELGKAIKYNRRTEGRKRIIIDKLTVEDVAVRILNEYKEVLK